MSDANPILVEQRRGDHVESAHRGAAVVVDASGKIIRSVGDVERPLIVNSAIKLLQALPFLATGAAERWACSDAEIALAAASQIGQEFQRTALKQWLERLDLPVAALQCGITEPFDRGARNALIRLGTKPNVFHNNNVGKHIAVLATCLHHGEPIGNYLAPHHPAQLRIRAAISEFVDPCAGFADTFDRCGMPTRLLSLKALATSSARLSRPRAYAPEFTASAERLLRAIRATPEYLVGPGRLSTEVCRGTAGRIIVKGGSEGVYTAVDTDRSRGYAIKIDDGASRAADLAILALLNADGALSPSEVALLEPFHQPKIADYRGAKVGVIAAVIDTCEADFMLACPSEKLSAIAP